MGHGFLRTRDGDKSTFTAPGAGNAADLGTFLTFTDGLNKFGAVAGDRLDANGANHGYIRSRNGTFTLMDVPGAATGSGQGSSLAGINWAGAASRNYFDSNTMTHGLLRTPDGDLVK